MEDRGRLIYTKSLTKGKIQMILSFILGLLILLISTAMWRAGIISSNFYLILFGIILTIFIIFTNILSLLDVLFFLDFKVYENGIDNPVPLLKKLRKESFYSFDDIVNLYITDIHLIIETENGKNPIALNLLGKDYDKTLQIALEAQKRYYDKKGLNPFSNQDRNQS